MGIPKVKWAKIVKIDHIVVQEGVLESAETILACFSNVSLLL